MCHTSVQIVRESWVSSGVLLLSLVEEEEVTQSMTVHLLVAQLTVMYHQQKPSQEVVVVVEVMVMVTEKCSFLSCVEGDSGQRGGGRVVGVTADVPLNALFCFSVFGTEYFQQWCPIKLQNNLFRPQDTGLEEVSSSSPGLVDFAWQVILKLAYSTGKGPGKWSSNKIIN